MRSICPRCAEVLVLKKDAKGLSYCPHCHKLVPPAKLIPTWIVELLMVLMAVLLLQVFTR